ncbi:LysR family transcriptional regulator [Amycolatopsis rifamycinica]|uniref:LysR family transcriptional regulator n=1 Tax=Amycolatopsis rifamycinica TaxID=287986 RepID=A0A066TQK9_9PSEU|nr:LysR family transcriptional regulator [Amycolatopsis rifamycinica]KDN17451.1 LysR family transcriptional regulator [Amycolatopsis rifamycinica]
MELRQLAVVVAVAEEGGFTAAAQRLRTVQSTVSTVVRALERDLGTPLFHRTTHRVVLTPAGEAFVPAARAALEAAERARAAVSPVRGRVRVGVCPGLLADLPRTLTALRHAHPGLEVAVRSVRPEEVACAVWQSDVDMVVTPAGGDLANSAGHASGPAPTSGGDLPTFARNALGPATPAPTAPTSGGDLANSARNAPGPATPAPGDRARTTTLLPPEELILVTAPGGSRSAPADLSALSFVDFPPGWAIREAVDRAFPGRRISLEVDDLAVAVELVRGGFAACVLPASAAARFPALTVRRFARPVPWQLAAVHRAEPGAAVAAVLAQLG